MLTVPMPAAGFGGSVARAHGSLDPLQSLLAISWR
jgi:hypothetical protein